MNENCIQISTLLFISINYMIYDFLRLEVPFLPTFPLFSVSTYSSTELTSPNRENDIYFHLFTSFKLLNEAIYHIDILTLMIYHAVCNVPPKFLIKWTTPISAGMLSNPHEPTIYTPFSFAFASQSNWTLSKYSGSPLTSTQWAPASIHASTTSFPLNL